MGPSICDRCGRALDGMPHHCEPAAPRIAMALDPPRPSRRGVWIGIGIAVVLVLGLFVLTAVLVKEPVMTLIKEAQFSEHYEQGNQHYDAEDYDAALKEYEEMVRLFPDRADGYMLRGLAKHGKGKTEEALTEYETAFQHHPSEETRATLHHYRGSVREDQGDYDQALEDYDKSLQIQPENDDLREARVKLLLSAGEYERLKRVAGEELRNGRITAEAHCTRGLAYCALGEYGKGLPDLKVAVKEAPTFEHWSNLADYQYDSGDVQGAAYSVRQALALDKNAVAERFELGLYYAVLNDRARARAAYRQVAQTASETERLAARLDLNAAAGRFPRSRLVREAAAWVPAGK